MKRIKRSLEDEMTHIMRFAFCNFNLFFFHPNIWLKSWIDDLKRKENIEDFFSKTSIVISFDSQEKTSSLKIL